MFGYSGFNRIGYDSPMDTNPFIPGTQLHPLDADPFTPGIQLPGSINRVPHYDGPFDTNPFLAGTQVGGMTVSPVGMTSISPMGYGSIGYGAPLCGTTYTTTTTYGPRYF